MVSNIGALPGTFVTFEGVGDTATTQARLFAERVHEAGHESLLVRDPGDTVGAGHLRSLMFDKKIPWSPEAEILLRTAARRDLLDQVVWPALRAGKIVVCSGYVDGERIRWGAASARLRDEVDLLHDTMVAQEANLTFVLDPGPVKPESTADEETILRLVAEEGMRVDFQLLVEKYQNRIKLIDARGTDDVVASRVWEQFLRVANMRVGEDLSAGA